MPALGAPLVGDLRSHDLLFAGGLFLLDDRPTPEDEAPAPLLVAFLDPLAAIDDAARREIGALDEPPQLFQRSVGVVDQVLDGLDRSEEHTSELQSPCNLVCRLLLEKKKQQKQPATEEAVTRSNHKV